MTTHETRLHMERTSLKLEMFQNDMYPVNIPLPLNWRVHILIEGGHNVLNSHLRNKTSEVYLKKKCFCSNSSQVAEISNLKNKLNSTSDCKKKTKKAG